MGDLVGDTVVYLLGVTVFLVGVEEGINVGEEVLARLLGVTSDGTNIGLVEGEKVVFTVGTKVGFEVGSKVGSSVGFSVGTRVGFEVGLKVGSSVS